MVFNCSRVKRARASSRSPQPQLGAFVVCSATMQQQTERQQHTATKRYVLHRKV